MKTSTIRLVGAILLAMTLGLTAVQAQTLNYDKVRGSKNVESVVLSGMMIRMGLSQGKDDQSEHSQKMKEAFKDLSKMRIFTSHNDAGNKELQVLLAPILRGKDARVETILDQSDKDERVRIIGYRAGEDHYSSLFIVVEEGRELNVIVMEGKLKEEYLLDLAGASGAPVSTV